MNRIDAIDNVKIFAIFFVVFGHLIEPLINSDAVIKTIYLSIYSFHMPVFVIIAGVLSKSELSKERLRKNIATILIPFLVFTVLYEIFNVMIYGDISGYTKSIQPCWIMWFLFSLFIWKLLIPIVSRVRFFILISVLVSLGVGYADSVGYFLGVSRTLYFFPFFLIGYQFSYLSLSNKRLPGRTKVVYFIVLILNVAYFWWFRELPHQWLYGSCSYKALGADGVYGFVIRLTMYTLSLVTSVSVIMLVADTKTKISKLGRNSLYVYVWHGFFVKLFVSLGLVGFVGSMAVPITLGIIVFWSLVLTLILSTNFVAQITQDFVLYPVRNILLRKSQYVQ